MLIVAIFLPSISANTCTLSTSRTTLGIDLICTCPGRHTTIVPQTLSVDVSAACISTCSVSEELDEACDSGDSSVFKTAARSAQSSCCPQCGGTFKAETCVRIFLEGRPLLPPSVGCVNKVRGAVFGDVLACRCKSGLNFEVGFFLASGVDERCIQDCAREKLGDICIPGESRSKITGGFIDLFGICCSEKCGGKLINGGFACGFDIS